MDNTAGRAATDSAKTPLVPPPPRPRPRGLRRLLTPVSNARRRPLRAIGILFLLAVIGIAAGAGGFVLWTNHHLSASRLAVGRGHYLEAIRHLQICNK